MFVSTQKEIRVGDQCVTTKKVESFSGYFEVGTNVIVTDIGDRGYSLSILLVTKLLNVVGVALKSYHESLEMLPKDSN